MVLLIKELHEFSPGSFTSMNAFGCRAYLKLGLAVT